MHKEAVDERTKRVWDKIAKSGIAGHDAACVSWDDVKQSINQAVSAFSKERH